MDDAQHEDDGRNEEEKGFGGANLILSMTSVVPAAPRQGTVHLRDNKFVSAPIPPPAARAMAI
jgi:hypothetical protein